METGGVTPLHHWGEKGEIKMLQVLKITTIGIEVWEDEMGPTIGYDNIQTYFMIVPDDFDDFDPENTRSIEHVCNVQTLGM